MVYQTSLGVNRAHEKMRNLCGGSKMEQSVGITV